MPNEAALQLLLAIEKLERELERRLAQIENERAAQRHESLAREIRRAFAPVARRLPQYDLFDVRGKASEAGSGPAASGAELPSADEPGPEGASRAPAEVGASEAPDQHEAPGPRDEPSLFPPGPLHAVRIVPARLKLAPATERGLVARALDADGRPASGPVEHVWRLEGPGTLTAEGDRALYAAPDAEAEARIELTASQDGRTAAAEASVVVRETAASSGDRTAGIPEPQPVNAPSEPWRSRLSGERWQYNEGHRDYRAVEGEEPRRLRYLIHLFAKEVVLKNFGAPQEEGILERMVEVLTHLGDSRGR